MTFRGPSFPGSCVHYQNRPNLIKIGGAQLPGKLCPQKRHKVIELLAINQCSPYKGIKKWLILLQFGTYS